MSPPARNGLLARVALAYLGAVAVFALAASVLALRDHQTELFVDDWRVLDHYQSRPLPTYLFTAENGHYVPATLALFALDHEWLGGRMDLLAAASVACTALAAGFLCRAFRSHDGLADPVSRIALGFGGFALFWAASAHDLLWGLNQGSLQAVALVVIALAALGRVDPAHLRGSRGALALALAAALGATLSQSVGVASWAALVAVAVVRRFPWRVVAALAAAGALVVALFAASLPPHPKVSFADSLAFAVRRPFSLVELALAFVGSAPARVAVGLGLGEPVPLDPSREAWAAHTRDLYRLAVAFGTGALGLFAALAVARWRRPVARSAPDALALGLMAFAIAGAFLVGFARAAIFGPAAAVQLRFITWSTLFWVGAACALAPRSPGARAGPRARRVALLLPVLSACMLPALRDAREFHRTTRSQASKLSLALLMGLRHDELARNVSLHEAELVYRVAARLEAGGRPPFQGPRRGLRGARLRDRFSEVGGCLGALESTRRLRGLEAAAAEASGWLSPPAGRAIPSFVVLADGDGVIRGLADFAAAPPRSRAVARAGEERSGWAGFIADYDPSEAYAAHAVLADGRSACRLGPAP